MAQRATSLGPKPSLFIFVVFVVLFFFGFVFWLFNTEKKNFFPPEKGIFGLFSVFLFLSPLALLGPPSFSVSLSLSLFFLLFFLPSFFSLFFLSFGSLFLSLFCFFSLSSLLFFHERKQHQNSKLQVFFPEIISLFKFPAFFFQVPFSYLCSFLILSYVFCST